MKDSPLIFKNKFLLVESEIAKLEKETTFIDDCRICGARKVQCLSHHFIPIRLLRVLPINKAKRWVHQKTIICTKYNSYVHPENRLYQKIAALERELKLKVQNAGT